MSVTKNVFTLKKAYELIVAGEWPTYVSTFDAGTLFAWGCNGSYGHLGLGCFANFDFATSPTQIAGTTWNFLTGNDDLVMGATKSDGTLWVWGYNASGQLGLGDLSARSAPFQVPGSNWGIVGTTGSSMAATKTDGTLWSWGYDGTSGNLAGAPRSSPIQIPGNNWSYVTGGSSHMLAIKTDGTMWAWGYNDYGQLGVATTNFRSPAQVPGTNWVYVSAGGQNSMGRKSDGTAWVWGRNQFGQLGLNNTGDQGTPQQLPGNNWSVLDAYSANGCGSAAGLKTNGTLWAWGQNCRGQLGQSDTVHRSSPIQIPGTTWSDVRFSSDNQMVALKKDNTIWSWGFGIPGVPGSSSPINSFAGNNWIAISTGYRVAHGRKKP